VNDQKRSIAKKATDLTPKLIEMGFETRDDLKNMKEYTVLMAALGLNYVEANSLVNDAMAIHQQLATPLAATADVADLTIPDEKNKQLPYKVWTGKLELSGLGSSIYTSAELHRWLAALLCFVEAQSSVLGPLLREFCLDPGMLDPEYQLLHAKIPEFHDRQLAHAISSSLPSLIQERITTKLGIASLGLDILRQVTAVHYGASAVKFKIAEAADLCYNKVTPVTSRSDLQGALDKHLQAFDTLEANGQPLGDAMNRAGLNDLVSKLQMADEITAATNIIESTGDWTSTHLIALIRRRAGEWIFLPPLPYKEIACAGVFKYTTQCHQWLAGSCKKSHDCKWLHDPEFKGRKDLLPFCNRMDVDGNCPLSTCIFQHPIPSVPKHVAASATGVPPALPSGSSYHNELVEIKNILLGLLTEQTAQKALIADMLAEATTE